MVVEDEEREREKKMEVALEKVDEFPVENNAVLRSFVAPGYLASRVRRVI